MDYKKDDEKLSKRNASGCYDLTAYEAIKKADADAEYEKVRKVISIIYKLCDLCHFQVEERIILKDKRTGKVWR